MTLPHFPPGTPEHTWMVEQVDAIVTRWEAARDAATWTASATTASGHGQPNDMASTDRPDGDIR